MNPVTALIVKNLNDKLSQLHKDNQRIISLLENISQKEKIIVKVYKEEKENPQKEKLKMDQFEKDLWLLF